MPNIYQIKSLTYSASNSNTMLKGTITNVGGNNWREVNNQGQNNFVTVQQSSNYLQLFDASRDLYLTVSGNDISVSFPGRSNAHFGSVLTETQIHNANTSITSIKASGQTVHSDFVGDDVFQADHHGRTNFVFSHGFGQAFITGFTATGINHDTLHLLASDFTGIADVLRHTHSSNGGSVITDPRSHDTINLAGVGKFELTNNRRDFILG